MVGPREDKGGDGDGGAAEEEFAGLASLHEAAAPIFEGFAGEGGDEGKGEGGTEAEGGHDDGDGGEVFAAGGDQGGGAEGGADAGAPDGAEHDTDDELAAQS